MPALPTDTLATLLEALRTYRNARRAAGAVGVNQSTAWRVAKKHGIALISLAEHMKVRRADPVFRAKQVPAVREAASRWLKAAHAKPKFHKKSVEAARLNLTRLNCDPAFREASSERLKRLHEDPAFGAKLEAARRAARKRRKAQLQEKAIEAAIRTLTRLDGDPAFLVAVSERLKRLLRAKEASAARPPRNRGFAIAPILYLLGLIGVGAGVLFSGYSQILRSNQTMSNTLAAKNDLQGTATTLAASSWLSTDQTLLCPPLVGSNSPSTPSAKCSSSVSAITVGTSFASAVAANLPANYASVSSTGTPVEVGVFAAGSGAKVLDPWGHYYIYCRWENAIGTANAIMVITAGANGKLETKCGDTTAQGDDMFVVWTTAVTQNRAAVWQTITSGTSVTGAQFGATGTQVNIQTNGNVNIPGTLGVTGATALGTAGLSVTGNTALAGLSASTGTFSGAVSATNGSFSGTFSASGMTTLGALSAGTSTLSSLSVTNNGTVGGTLGVTGALTAGSSTLSSLSVTGTTYLGGNATTSNGVVQIGTSVAASGTSAALLTVGKAVSNVYPFTIDQYGAVTGGTFTGSFNGNLTGSQSGGSVSATTLAASGATTLNSTLGVTGVTTLSAALNGTSAVFSGSVQAASFVGTMSIGGGGVTLSGVVPIANGGTGQTNAAAALAALGVTSGGYLNTGLLTSNLIPGADIVNNSITTTQLNTTGVTAGTYTSVTVGVDGRITAGGSGTSLSDGSGDSVGVGTTGVLIKLGNSVVGNWTSTGLMVGTSTAALDKLDVYGATAIGTGYAGVTAAPTNGLIVQGNVGIGTNNPLGYALDVSGTVAATNFSGSGAGLTGIGTSSLSGTVGTGNGGTGTNIVFTQGSVVFAGASGIYSQDNSQFYWNDSTHSLGIGTTSPNDLLNIYAGSGNIGLRIDNNSNTASDYDAIRLRQAGTEQAVIYTNQGNLHIHSDANNLLLQESSGNVGIGTTNPSAANGLGQNLVIEGSGNTGISIVAPNSAGANSTILFSNASNFADDGIGYNVGTHALTFYTNSFASRMTVDSTGNVGIGATSYYGKLSIGNSSADGTSDPTQGLVFTDTTSGVGNTWSGSAIYNVGSAGFRGNLVFATNNAGSQGNTLTEQMRILASGKVGIGTAAPQSLLHLQAGEVQVGSSGVSCTAANAGAIRYNAGILYYCDNSSTWESIDSSGAGNAGDYVEVTQTTPSPTGSSQGYLGASATLGGIVSGYGTTADVTLENRSNTPALEVLANATTLYAPGNVGINTTSPGQKLSVAGGAMTFTAGGLPNPAVGIGNTQAAAVAELTGFYTYDSTSGYQGWIGGIGVGGEAGGWGTKTLRFQVPDGSGNVVNALNILGGSGNVGIGNTAPSAKLSVGASALGGTATSTTLNTYAGSLSSTASTDLALASFGFGSTNASSLGIHAYRVSAGSDWTTTALGLGMDVDNTTRVNNSGLWFSYQGNVGIGTVAPRAKLELNGSLLNTTAYNGNTNLGSYDIGVGSIGAGASIYSYGYICAGNASGACNGAGGVVMGSSANASAAINIPTTGNVFFNNGSNVGIGKTNPGTALDVNGTVTATSFSGSGAGLTSVGVSSLSGVVPIANGGTAASSQTSSGVAYYNGTALTTGTGFVYNGTSVGIGTPSPNNKLHVSGATGDTKLYINDTRGAGGVGGSLAEIGFGINNGSHNIGNGDTAKISVGADAGTYGTMDFYAYNVGTPILHIGGASGGVVGIGLTGPRSVAAGSLDANSAISFSNNANMGATDFTAAGWTSVGGGSIGWNKTGGFSLISISGGGSDGGFAFYDRNTQLVRILKNGNVGFGTTSPQGKLNINTNNAWGGGPANSGTTPTNLALRLEDNSNGTIDMGVNGTGSWLQATDKTNLGLHYNILLNPNGGNVGINTTSPGTALDVNGSVRIANGQNLIFNNASDSGITFYGSTAINRRGSDGSLLITSGQANIVITPSANTIFASGNVGIGNTSPNANLAIGASAGTVLWQNVGGSAEFATPLLQVSAANTNTSTPQTIGLNLSNTSGTNNTASPAISFSRYSNSTSYNDTYADIVGIATGQGGDTNWVSGVITFRTTPVGAYGPQERMRIDSTGNVGIGNTSPSTALQVTGTVTATQFVGGGAGLTGVTATLSGGVTNYVARWTSSSALGTGVLYDNGTNVGIGNTSPGYTLDVNGTINSNNWLYSNELYTRDNLYIGYLGDYLSNRLNQAVTTGAQPNFWNIYVGYMGTYLSGWLNQPLTTGNAPQFAALGIGVASSVSALNVVGNVAGGVPSLSADTGSIATFTSPTTVQVQIGALGGSPYTAWIQSKVDGQNASYGLALQPAGGNVGIGNTSPSYKLDVSGSMRFSGAIYNASGPAYMDEGYGWRYEGDTQHPFQVPSGGLLVGYTAAGSTYAAGSAAFAGNVGVGQASPNAKFDVSSNGGSDGLVIFQQVDNTETIQTYIDGQYANRTTYAGACCNTLKIEPDAGNVIIYGPTAIGNSNASGSGVTVNGTATFANTITVGSGQFATNGDHYMSWAGVWASSWLNQSVASGSSPNFYNPYIGYMGTNLSNWVNQSVTTSAAPTFSGGVQIGSGIATGYYGDGSNIALRVYNSGGSTIYFQAYNGASTFGTWNSSGLTVSNAAVFNSTATFNSTLNISGGNVLYFNSYGGGWYMVDGTWIRSYGGKNVYIAAGLDTGGASGVACGGGLGGGYTFRVCGSEEVTSTLEVTANTYSNNYYHNSDRRLKDNIKPIAGLDIVEKLNGVTFNWKKDGKPSAGVIAQDVEQVMPEAVSTNTKGMKSVSYDTLIAPLIEAVKELKAANDNNVKEIAALHEEIKVLKAKSRSAKP